MTLALFFTLYCIEAGFFFLVLPWTKFWTQNPLVYHYEPLGQLLTNLYVRGFISGFGLVHFLVAIHEVAAMIRRKKREARG